MPSVREALDGGSTDWGSRIYGATALAQIAAWLGFLLARSTGLPLLPGLWLLGCAAGSGWLFHRVASTPESDFSADLRKSRAWQGRGQTALTQRGQTALTQLLTVSFAGVVILFFCGLLMVGVPSLLALLATGLAGVGLWATSVPESPGARAP